MSSYEPPVRADQSIAEVGVPLITGSDTALVPVRFHTGKHGIYVCSGAARTHFVLPGDEATKLVAESSKMPVIHRGIGSDVWHIVVYEGDKDVLIKSYYNEKAWRGDEIYR